MVTPKVRYNTAATVSDEHGKGGEVLRQVISEGSNDHNRTLLYAEVDLIVRSAYAYHRGSSTFTDGTIIIRKREINSSSTVDLTSSLDMTTIPDYGAIAIPLVANTRVNRGEMVEVLVEDATPTSSSWTVIVGWMPDLWSSNANARSYVQPS